MHTYSSHGGFETFAESASNDIALVYNQLQPVSDRIAYSQPGKSAYQSAVVFSLDPSNPEIASAITTVESPDTDLDEREFRGDYIDYRRVLLANTALGDYIREGNTEEPHFALSKLNPTKQIMYTERLFDPHAANRHVIGAVQYGFNSALLDRLPTNDAMEAIRAEASEAFDDIGAIVSSLQQRAPNLSRSLEILPSAIPNVVAIRWDVQDSTSIETGRGAGTYNAYLDYMKGALHTLVSSINNGESTKPFRFLRDLEILERGDGQNIIIPLPRNARYIDPKHPESYRARVFATQEAQPLVEEIMAIQHMAAQRYYYGAGPIIRTGIGVGYVEAAPYGDLSGPVLSEISKLPYRGLGRVSLSYDAKKVFTKFDE